MKQTLLHRRPSERGAHRAVALRPAAWRDPVFAAAPFADEPYALCLLSSGVDGGRWSYLLRRPSDILDFGPAVPGDPCRAAAEALSPLGPGDPAGPPFQGGLAGLAGYELGARYEATAPQTRDPDWPDLVVGLYPALLAFDHEKRRVVAVGRGADEPEAAARAEEALAWLQANGPEPSLDPPAGSLRAEAPPSAYEHAVAEVVEAIARGEIFQANAAQAWLGRLKPGAHPFDLFARAAEASPAPFAAYFRLPGKAVVSNSPERFLNVAPSGLVTAQPIKGTAPRGATPEADKALADALEASVKDRAENLMIVDLMRNDLSRACVPGTVRVPELCVLKSYANVHHLVSTVTGRLEGGKGAFDLLAAAFPPGSVTGAPKLQAMQVIARHEPRPRGPYCGSMFWAGFDGAFESSVLIRTVALVGDGDGWRFEARAGAGLVADSDPVSERKETEDKLQALARALTGRPL